MSDSRSEARFTPVNSPSNTPSPPKRAREEQLLVTPKRYRGRSWYTHNPYLQAEEEASVQGDALVDSPGDTIPQFSNLDLVAEKAVNAALGVSLLPPEPESESSGSDDLDANTQLQMEYDDSLEKNKGKAEPSNRRSVSVLSSTDDNPRQQAIEYLSRRCLGKVKGLEKGSVDLKPVPIVKQPVFDARSPLFAVACCLRCSKLVGSEGLFCVRPSKHAKCYRCANNGVPCEPIPASYKAEFGELQTLFQTGTLADAFAARDRYLKGVNAYAHSRSSKPKAKSRVGSASAGLSDEYREYWDEKMTMHYRNQERMINALCKLNGDPSVRPIEELFDVADNDPFAGFVEQPED